MRTVQSLVELCRVSNTLRCFIASARAKIYHVVSSILNHLTQIGLTGSPIDNGLAPLLLLMLTRIDPLGVKFGWNSTLTSVFVRLEPLFILVSRCFEALKDF